MRGFLRRNDRGALGSPRRAALRDIHGQAVQKVFQRILAREQRCAVRTESALPKSDAHGPPLAANLPAPGTPLAAIPGHDDVERSAQGTKHLGDALTLLSGFGTVLQAIADA